MPRELIALVGTAVPVTQASVAAIPDRPVLIVVYAGEPRDVVAIVDLRRSEIPRARAALLALSASSLTAAPVCFTHSPTVRGTDRKLLRLRRSQGRGEPARQQELLRLLGRPEVRGTRRDRLTGAGHDPSALAGIEFESHGPGGVTGAEPG